MKCLRRNLDDLLHVVDLVATHVVLGGVGGARVVDRHEVNHVGVLSDQLEVLDHQVVFAVFAAVFYQNRNRAEFAVFKVQFSLQNYRKVAAAVKTDVLHSLSDVVAQDSEGRVDEDAGRVAQLEVGDAALSAPATRAATSRA